jgi:Short C-terminal domain
MDTERTVLGALSRGDPDLLAAGLEVRAEWQARSGLDDRGYALVEIAALIALDAVMFRRRRPLLRRLWWAAARKWPGRTMPGTRCSGSRSRKNRDARISEVEQQQAPSQQAPPPAPSSPMIDQLNQLATLHQQGVLTDDEFAAAKAKLFGT